MNDTFSPARQLRRQAAANKKAGDAATSSAACALVVAANFSRRGVPPFAVLVAIWAIAFVALFSGAP